MPACFAFRLPLRSQCMDNVSLEPLMRWLMIRQTLLGVLLAMSWSGVAGWANTPVNGALVRLDLLTDQPTIAAEFYEAVFGWTTEPTTDPAMRLLIGDGIAIGHIVDHEPADPQVSEVQWLPSLAIDDPNVDPAAFGGSMLLSAITGPHGERLSVVADPEGAPVALLGHSESWRGSRDLVSDGRFWVELLAENQQRASLFYKALLAYESRYAGSDPESYLLLTSEDKPRAGIVQKPWDDVASSWLVYVRVSSVAETLDRVAAAGGSVLLGPRTSSSGGKVAIVADPTGGVIAVQEQVEREHDDAD